MSLIALPADKSAEDSDTEPCGGDAGDLRHVVVSQKQHGVNDEAQGQDHEILGPEGVGNCVFTTSDTSTGATLLVKGMWFTDMDQVNAWLNQQHPLTGQAMSRNIVELHFSTPPEGNNITYYFVMTGLAGYVNAYPGIIQRPNAQLAFNPDRPLGQHSLQVRLVADLQAVRESLIAYGARHGLKDKSAPGPS